MCKKKRGGGGGGGGEEWGRGYEAVSSIFREEQVKMFHLKDLRCSEIQRPV